MRFSKQMMTLTVLSIMLSSAAIVQASDACKNVKFKFTNKHNSGGTIEMHQIKYFNKANGEWKTDDLKDTDCKQGNTCTTAPESLRDAEGEDLTKFRFIYRYKGHTQATIGPTMSRAEQSA